ncbi:MAG: hypothetical protein Q9P01_00070 [Anaerolineae bacterium]|nr:hypothetical protein [Anaerolineae bacterium]MDQ7033268.1 hypothetical protein [Anaerolineae bacterium]
MAKSSNASNFHTVYQNVTTQHWHPSSERYAGGDHLMTAIDKGWKVEKCVLVRHWYAGMRSVVVYEFNLKRDSNTMMMPVIDNPYIGRFIEESDIELIVSDNAKIQ